MEKETYLKPSMQVIELQKHQPLLAGSGSDGPGPDEGYIPNMREDMNQMA